MPGFCASLLMACLACATAALHAGNANRLSFLDSDDPFYVSLESPPLLTPQWVGESGVDAVVEKLYAITTERRMQHPAAIAVSQAASREVFNVTVGNGNATEDGAARAPRRGRSKPGRSGGLQTGRKPARRTRAARPR